MRLLFVTQDFPPDVGGIQTYSWELARRLASATVDFEVIAPHRPTAGQIDEQTWFSVTRVPGQPDLLPITALPVVPRRAWRQRTDVAVHAQWQTVGTSVLARALTGHPRRIVCAAHGRELLFNPAAKIPGLTQAYDAIRRALLGQVDTALPVSRYTADLLRDLDVPSQRLHVIPNGTNPVHFSPHTDGALRRRLGLTDRSTLLTVGRLVPRKGIDTVLRALPLLIQTIPDLAYVVVGTGPDRSRLEQLARRLNVQDRVYFEGYVDHERLPLYYSSADLFVLPAREAPPDVEGFGIVYLEANACGTPVIGARTGGVPDAIEHGETGLLVPPSDPEALARSATRILTTPDLGPAMGRKGRERVLREMNWDRIADRILSVLSS